MSELCVIRQPFIWRSSLPNPSATLLSEAILRVSLEPIGHKSSKSLWARRSLTPTSSDKSAFATWSEPFPMLESDYLSRMQQWHHQLSSGDVMIFDFDIELSGASLIENAPFCTGLSVQSVTSLLSPAAIVTCSFRYSSSIPRGRLHKTCT
jgi:hypothetical protein